MRPTVLRHQYESHGILAEAVKSVDWGTTTEEQRKSGDYVSKLLLGGVILRHFND